MENDLTSDRVQMGVRLRLPQSSGTTR
jgi:hypothetical protein